MPNELQAADVLLDQDDALLHRNRDASNLVAARGEDLAADDLPLLTEVVEPAPEALVAATPAPSPPMPPTPGDVLAERLAALDGLIAREVETWLAEELPQILSAELARLTEHVRFEALARMRSTLLPALSHRIEAALDAEAHPGVQP